MDTWCFLHPGKLNKLKELLSETWRQEKRWGRQKERYREIWVIKFLMSSSTVSLWFYPCCHLIHTVSLLYVCLYVWGCVRENVWWAMKDNGYGNVRHIQTHSHRNTLFGQTVVYHTDWIQGHNLTSSLFLPFSLPPSVLYVSVCHLSSHTPTYTRSTILNHTRFVLCYNFLC